MSQTARPKDTHTANITHLMDAVYQHFLDLYQQSSSSTEKRDIFLSFEPIGRTVDPDSYKLNPQDTEFFPAKAIEEFTELTDDIPLIDENVFYRTSKSVEETYGSFILNGARPGTTDQGEIDLFNHLLASSRQTFEDVKIGKFSQSGIQYRPAYADPQDWYNPTQTDNWTTYSYRMSSSHSSSTGKPSKPTPQKPGQGQKPGVFLPQRPIKLQQWQWHVLPQQLTPVLKQPQVLQQVSIDSKLLQQATATHFSKQPLLPTPVSAQPSTTAVKPTNLQPFAQKLTARSLTTQKLTTNPTKLSRSPLKTTPTTSVSSQQRSEQHASRAVLSAVTTHQTQLHNSFQTQTTLNQQIKDNQRISQLISPAILKNIQEQLATPKTPSNQSTTTATSPRLQSAATAVLLDHAHTQSVTSKELTISFQYCLVNAERPWLSQSLLQTKGWYIPGYEAGDFSKGTPDSDGIFPALPIAFIVVKDLKISNWNQSEQKHVEDSVALGPFSLIGREVNGTQLSYDGMQVIGWISQVMPAIPPLSDPNTN